MRHHFGKRKLGSIASLAPMLFSLLGWRSDDHTPEIGRVAEDKEQVISLTAAPPVPAQPTQGKDRTIIFADEITRRWAERPDVQQLLKAA